VNASGDAQDAQYRRTSRYPPRLVAIEALVVEVTDDDVRDPGVLDLQRGDHFGDDGTNVAVNTLGPNLKLAMSWTPMAA
jgi:hypothetical protein